MSSKNEFDRVNKLYRHLIEELKIKPKKAFDIIWYLQEIDQSMPENIERCDKCNNLYDDRETGDIDEKTGKHYCGKC